MVARLYTPRTASTVSPAFDASWNVTNQAFRRKATAIPTDTNHTIVSVNTPVVGGSPVTVLIDQLTSDPITVAVTISGTVTALVAASSRFSSGTLFRIVVKVVSNNGTVVRGTLFAGSSSTAISSSNSYIPIGISGTVTPINAQVGDRIVIERGVSVSSSGGSSPSLIAGDPFDIPETSLDPGFNGGTFGGRPWVEFSQDNIWQPIIRRTGGIAAEVLADPSRTTARVGGASVEALLSPPRQKVQVGGLAIEVLQPRSGQRIRALNPVGFPDSNIYTKHPDGSWRAIDLVIPTTAGSGFQGPRPQDLPMMIEGVVGSSVQNRTFTSTPLSTDLLVFVMTTSNAQPKSVVSGPSGVPGVNWILIYSSPPETGGYVRTRVWTGRGATAPGRVDVTLSASDTSLSLGLIILRNVTGTIISSDTDFVAAGGTLSLDGSGINDRRVGIMVGTRSTGSVVTFTPSRGWVQMVSGTAGLSLVIDPTGATSETTTVSQPPATAPIAIGGTLIILE